MNDEDKKKLITDAVIMVIRNKAGYPEHPAATIGKAIVLNKQVQETFHEVHRIEADYYKEHGNRFDTDAPLTTADFFGKSSSGGVSFNCELI